MIVPSVHPFLAENVVKALKAVWKCGGVSAFAFFCAMPKLTRFSPQTEEEHAVPCHDLTKAADAILGC